MPDWQTCTIQAVDDQVSCEVDGRALLLHVSSGTYFGLNPTGALVWPLIQRGTTSAEIVSTILETYEVDAKQVENDVRTLLDSLLGAGLIRITHARAS